MMDVGFEGGYLRSNSMSSLLFTLGALRPREGRVLPEVRTRRQAPDHSPVVGTVWAFSGDILQTPWASVSSVEPGGACVSDLPQALTRAGGTFVPLLSLTPLQGS